MSTSDRETQARREALFRTCVPLAYQRAGRATPIGRRFGLTKDDLAQAGLMGVWHATSKFDPGRGVKFVTYAAWWIRSYIGRAIAVAEKQQLGFSAETDVSTSGGPRGAGVGGVGLVELLSAIEAPDLDAEAEAEAAELHDALPFLPARSRRVLVERYGLGRKKPRTLREVSKLLGVTKERVRQLQEKATDQLGAVILRRRAARKAARRRVAHAHSGRP